MSLPRGPNFRRAALERDGYACRLCGLRPESMAVLQAAQIKPIAFDGAHTLDNVITLCANCHAQADANADRDYLGAIISESPGAIIGFQEAITKVRALNRAPLPSNELSVALRNLLFASVIAALETYLSDAIVGAVTRERALVKRALASVPELRERKVELSKLFERIEGIDTEVRNYLLDVVYHNLGKVKPLYSSILGVKLPEDMDAVIHAIHTRHDIVHRNGKTKEGTPIMSSAEDVDEVASLVEAFVAQIELQVAQKPWRE